MAGGDRDNEFFLIIHDEFRDGSTQVPWRAYGSLHVHHGAALPAHNLIGSFKRQRGLVFTAENLDIQSNLIPVVALQRGLTERNLIIIILYAVAALPRDLRQIWHKILEGHASNKAGCSKKGTSSQYATALAVEFGKLLL